MIKSIMWYIVSEIFMKLTKKKICNFTIHTRERVDDFLDNHYSFFPLSLIFNSKFSKMPFKLNHRI